MVSTMWIFQLSLLPWFKDCSSPASCFETLVKNQSGCNCEKLISGHSILFHLIYIMSILMPVFEIRKCGSSVLLYVSRLFWLFQHTTDFSFARLLLGHLLLLPWETPVESLAGLQVRLKIPFPPSERHSASRAGLLWLAVVVQGKVIKEELRKLHLAPQQEV